jgi:hypothetical protein|tara:strand:- start:577 stop:834 length:258 start_codon:yes stop_codon:yes gene_type:complete
MNYKDIDTMIESMTAEQIRSVMATIKQKGNVRRIDTSHRERRNELTSLYFSVAPLPHKTTYEEYKEESEAIRQQVISGVDVPCQR